MILLMLLCGSAAIAMHNDVSASLNSSDALTLPRQDGGVDASQRFELFVSYKKIPRMPLKNIFGEDAKSEKKPEKAAIIEPALITKPLVTPKAITIKTTPKLVGVIIRSRSKKAFFVDDKVHNVKVGDLLVGSYRVVSIHTDRVDIVDNRTNLKRSIYLKD